MAWEGGGLRIALAVDAYIYFANIRYERAYRDLQIISVTHLLTIDGGTAFS